jgi:g-D-glutamyl-meso-diaminopimelate peptidase
MPVLRLGARGPFVEAAQLALQRAGLLNTDPDGIFGVQTAEAVRKFQRQNALPADGIIGVATWQRLLPYLKGYRTVIIRKGDSFWTLANRYDTTISAIATANPTLQAENLPVGRPIIIPLGFPLIPTNITYTSQLLTYIVDGLTTRYPFIVSSSIGNSVLGKPLWLLRIGQGRKQVSFNASHHGNEWITTPVVLKFLEDYANAYINGEDIGGQSAEDLFKNVTLYLIPMVNPDGVDLAGGGLTTGRAYRQAVRLAENYPQIPFPDGWKANINGIDLNLQYPALWERAREIKFAQGFRLPGPRDYVGTAPLTQPEALAMVNFTRNHNFALILAYHSQGELIYYRFADFDPPKADQIGQALSDASGYTLEITPEASGYAGYKDWFIQTYNRPGYTIEVGRGVNPLPISQFDRIYNDNVGLMATALALA